MSNLPGSLLQKLADKPRNKIAVYLISQHLKTIVKKKLINLIFDKNTHDLMYGFVNGYMSNNYNKIRHKLLLKMLQRNLKTLAYCSISPKLIKVKSDFTNIQKVLTLTNRRLIFGNSKYLWIEDGETVSKIDKRLVKRIRIFIKDAPEN